MIVEMAGRPAKHLTESLERHVSVLRKVEDVEVHKIKVSEPVVIVSEVEKNIPEEEKMLTAFAECDFEIPTFSRLSETMFDFMPSSVEVIEPTNVNLDMSEATNLLNNISGRMHRYDEFAKVAGEKIRLMSEQLEMAKKILIARDEKIKKLESAGASNEISSKKKNEISVSSKKKKTKNNITKSKKK